MKRWTAVAILISISILFLVVKLPSKGILFTCTTFFDFEKQDRWKTFCRAMNSILQQHSPETLQQITRWVIVNEYSESPKQDWSKLCAQKYPFLELIQKDSSQKGQAASMNVILQEIQGYDYWIHWEETWYCRAPCFNRMIRIMKNSTITQLQCTQLKDTPNWLDSRTHPHKCTQIDTLDVCLIYPSKDSHKFLIKSPYDYNDDYVPNWPLYSLLPSINRVRNYRSLGIFSEDPKLWPIKFEWEFGRRWLKAGSTKAVLPDGPVVRDNEQHKSTYS